MFGKVEFGGGIKGILQQSRVLLHDLQYTVQFGIIDCNMCACALCTAHAQYIIIVKGGGCKKVMQALMRN